MTNDNLLTTEELNEALKSIEINRGPTTWSIPMSYEERDELEKLQKTDPDEVQRRMQEMVKERGAIEFEGLHVKNIHLSRRVHARLLACEEFKDVR